MKSLFGTMASALAFFHLVVLLLFLQVDGLSLPRSDLSYIVTLFGVVNDKAYTTDSTEHDQAMDATQPGEEGLAQIEPRGALYTAEILTQKITELREKHGVGAVVQENQLVLHAFEAINSCSSGRSENEMRTYVGGSDWTEEQGVALAWEKWQDQLDGDDFIQKFDVWVATRPQWKMVGCAWGRYCEGGINGRGLSCMFWDANNNGTLGPPEI